ncbi:unnamed protein product, partial [Mesorhabditis belari]|uniref:MRH domain-containing protein n=1 Tax=Mesorhabditis belari TaxID=2138241 RepID=A0AAF3F9L6_9BILA
MWIFRFAIFFAFSTICRAGSFDAREFQKYKYQIELDDKLAGFPSKEEYMNLSFEDESQIESFFLQQIPSETDPRNHFITNKAGQKFLCQLPDSEMVNAKKTEINGDSLHPKYINEIVSVSFLRSKCIKKQIGWWHYEFCHGKMITQSHSTKGKSDFIQYTLGTFMGDRRMPDFNQSTKDKLLYLEEEYPMGTFCDVLGKKVARKTIVRYECDLKLFTEEAYIQSIVETSTCQYLMIIQTGSLCHLAEFIPTDDLVAPLGIKCSPYIDQEKTKQFAKRIFGKMTRKKEGERLLPIVMEKLKSAYRRLYAFKRTRLVSEERRNFRLQRRINSQIRVLNRELLEALYMKVEGEKLDEKNFRKMESLTKLSEVAVGREIYELLKDWDKGNFYYYLMDREWPKDEYPRTLDYVDFLNGYHVEIEELAALARTEEDAEWIRLFSKLDPNLWQHNLFVNKEQMLEKLVENLPVWFPKMSAKAIFENAGKEDFMRKLVDRYYLSIIENEDFYHEGFNAHLNEDLVDSISHYVLIVWFQEDSSINRISWSNFWMKHLKLMEMMMVATQYGKIIYSSENPNAVDVLGRAFDPDEVELAETMDWHEYYEYIEGTLMPGKRHSIRHDQEQLLIARAQNLRQTIFEEIWAQKKEEITESWREKLLLELLDELEKLSDTVAEEIDKRRLAELYQNEDKVELVKMLTEKIIEDEFQKIIELYEIFTEEELQFLYEFFVIKGVDDMLLMMEKRKAAKQEENYWGNFGGFDDDGEEEEEEEEEEED